ncbi:elongation of very long chain fatty acids protein-like protein, partial [Dinothrombium tinctorium]
MIIEAIRYLIDGYAALMANGDPRVANWPLMKSPFPTIIICISYIYFVKYLGPQLMKNRQPLDIRCLMIVYNFIMVLISALMFYLISTKAWFNGYSFKCEPVDYSPHGNALLIA